MLGCVYAGLKSALILYCSSCSQLSVLLCAHLNPSRIHGLSLMSLRLLYPLIQVLHPLSLLIFGSVSRGLSCLNALNR